MGRVVIIGAGPSGLLTAEKLKGHDVTVVCGNGFFEWSLAQTNAVSRPETWLSTVSTQGYKQKIPKPGRVVVGKAVAVDATKREVALENGTTIPYDVLVCATGFAIPGLLRQPGQTLAERQAEVTEIGACLKTAQCVLIGGGGVTAAMLAGDVREVVPEKCRVVVVCRGEALCAHLGPKSKQQLAAQLARQRIEVLPNEEVLHQDGPRLQKQRFRLRAQEVEADCYLPAFSKSQGHFLGPLANAQGQVVVNDALQSTQDPRVFSVACHDKVQFVTLMHVTEQAALVAKNVHALLQQKPLSFTYAEPSVGKGRHPAAQVLGHNTYAMLVTDVMPGPAACCVRTCGFPCCPILPCYVCHYACGGPCHPCACGWCCGEPHGVGTAKFLSMVLTDTGMTQIKGLGDAKKPGQQVMS